MFVIIRQHKYIALDCNIRPVTGCGVEIRILCLAPPACGAGPPWQAETGAAPGCASVAACLAHAPPRQTIGTRLAGVDNPAGQSPQDEA